MAIRTNEGDVRNLIGDSSVAVIAQIIMASEIVDALLASTSLSSVLLKNIEMYLAAHIWSLSNPDIVSESYGQAKFTYVNAISNSNMGFGSTKWGQTAITLDTTGTLLDLHKCKSTLEVLG